MKILLTAFDPFDHAAVNPAQEAVRQVKAPEGVELVRLLVPTVFGAAIDTVRVAMEQHRPDAVICVGQAGGRKAVTPERVAINLMDATICDNAGAMPVDQPVVPGGENALFSTLPIKAMVSAITAAGVPAQISNTAGTFVCNHLMYGVLHLCKERYPGTKAGFIHLPFLPEQAADGQMPSLRLDQMVLALETALQVLQKTT